MVTAEFIGYQSTANGNKLALFNICGGRLDKSTVTRRTLKREGINIPLISEAKKLSLTGISTAEDSRVG